MIIVCEPDILMLSRISIVFLLVAVISGCGMKGEPINIEPEHGFSISISGLKYVKSQKKIYGFVQLENKSSSFVKISNQEIILYCDNDSSRAFMKMPGEWEIDKGLINVMKGKTINYQAYWQFTDFDEKCVLSGKYVKLRGGEQ